MNLNNFNKSNKKFIFFNLHDHNGDKLSFTVEYHSDHKYSISCYDTKGNDINYLKRGITQVTVLNKLNNLLMPKE